MPTYQLILHLLCLLVLPPLFLGIVIKVKAAFAGRVGAPLFQLYFDLFKLMRKDVVLSTTSTWLFRAGPIVALVTTIMAGCLIPLGYERAPVAFMGDLVLFAYLFGLGRFFTVLAALDTGSSFEGMGAAREVTFACLAEPALFLGLIVLARCTSSLTLSTMLSSAPSETWRGVSAPLLLVVVSLFIFVLAETSRIPVDDPTTHLELTMIHEVMVLDHSGPPFAAILYAASVKLFVLGSIVIHAALPIRTGSAWGNWALFLVAAIVFAVAIGVVESTMARLRLRRVTNLLIAACLLSGFGVILLAR